MLHQLHWPTRSMPLFTRSLPPKAQGTLWVLSGIVMALLAAWATLALDSLFDVPLKIPVGDARVLFGLFSGPW